MTTTTNSPGRAAMTDVAGTSKSFGETRALPGVDMSVPAGTVQGLPGPNGAGKTTLVPILTTLLAPGTGRAGIRGVDVQQDPDTVRGLTGLAGQYAAVDETLTGRETLVMAGRLSQALAGKVVTGPSNPVGPDGHGGLARTLPEGESAASVVAKLLPAGARYVKAFGAVGAGEPGSGRPPPRRPGTPPRWRRQNRPGRAGLAPDDLEE